MKFVIPNPAPSGHFGPNGENARPLVIRGPPIGIENVNMGLLGRHLALEKLQRQKFAVRQNAKSGGNGVILENVRFRALTAQKLGMR